ncbi:alpha/beta hydrolase [Aquibaculum arenosum]|uniref:Prolyl oligopeptidase family serine peptidase n=1 Tax=Aquibaculum arenosum TaxID=3032591 RepID=A0ABT5YPZ7_9PROT|nr:alpha/beta fold hydrolase [Fodinicurvata sp. CAU 1616]MDF2097041.1 prolyl oligopeptidase family serine peptidase [Fodinicurvata sp. CAU 1616]
MTPSIELTGPRHEPASGGKADSLVVFLHGLGADGNDLIGLAPVLAQLFPDTAFVSPDAPQPCDMAPMGRQWFSLQDRSPAAMLAGAETARTALDGFLNAEMERHGLAANRVALFGFSQGCMMALHTALRRPEPLAGVVGCSGHLIAPERLADDVTARPPVLLVHGEADEVVPFAAMGAAEQALRAAEVPVEAHARPGLGHGIDQPGLELAARFLLKVLREG